MRIKQNLEQEETRKNVMNIWKIFPFQYLISYVAHFCLFDSFKAKKSMIRGIRIIRSHMQYRYFIMQVLRLVRLPFLLLRGYCTPGPYF